MVNLDKKDQVERCGDFEALQLKQNDSNWFIEINQGKNINFCMFGWNRRNKKIGVNRFRSRFFQNVQFCKLCFCRNRRAFFGKSSMNVRNWSNVTKITINSKFRHDLHTRWSFFGLIKIELALVPLVEKNAD